LAGLFGDYFNARPQLSHICVIAKIQVRKVHLSFELDLFNGNLHATSRNSRALNRTFDYDFVHGFNGLLSESQIGVKPCPRNANDCEVPARYEDTALHGERLLAADSQLGQPPLLLIILVAVLRERQCGQVRTAVWACLKRQHSSQAAVFCERQTLASVEPDIRIAVGRSDWLECPQHVVAGFKRNNRHCSVMSFLLPPR
jgi:hypothetical protein